LFLTVSLYGLFIDMGTCQPLYASLSFVFLYVYLTLSLNVCVCVCGWLGVCVCALAQIQSFFLSSFDGKERHFFKMQHATDLPHRKPNLDLVPRRTEYNPLKIRKTGGFHLGTFTHTINSNVILWTILCQKPELFCPCQCLCWWLGLLHRESISSNFTENPKTFFSFLLFHLTSQFDNRFTSPLTPPWRMEASLEKEWQKFLNWYHMTVP